MGIFDKEFIENMEKQLDFEIPEAEDAWDRLKIDELKVGLRVSWYEKEDLKFWEEYCLEEGEDFDPREMAEWSGVLAILPGYEIHEDSEAWFVIVDRTPEEKCIHHTSQWIPLAVLLNNEDLVEIF